MVTDVLADSKRWFGVIGLGVVLIILNLDMTIINVALPAIGETFGSSISTLAWINNSYSVAVAATVMVVTRLADNYGHRRSMLIGVWVFFLGSLLGGFAPTESILITARIIMGVGMAAVFPMVFILVLRLFSRSEHAFAVGLLIIFTGVSQAIGPSLGGLIVQWWGWHYTFLINPPICVLCFLLVFWAIPKDARKTMKIPIHYPSAILLLASLISLITAINQLNFWPMRLNFVVLCMGVALLFIFFLWQKRLRFPLISAKLFANRAYSLLCVIRSIFQINFGIILFLLPLYLQNVQGFSPLKSGLILLLMTGVMGVVSPFFGKLIDRYQLRVPQLFTLYVGFVGFALLLLQTAELHWGLLFTALLLLGVHISGIFSGTNYGAMAVLSQRKRAMGVGVFYTLAFFFFAVGAGVTGLLLDTVSWHHFATTPVSQMINADSLRPYLNASQSLQEIQGSYDVTVIAAVRTASAYAWWWLIALSTMLSLLNIMFGYFYKNKVTTHLVS